MATGAPDHPAGSLQSGSVVEELAHPPGTLRVVVVSPARPIYDGPARHLSIETLRGQVGIWPRHAELVAALGVGAMRIAKQDGGEDKWAVRGGFLKVGNDRVTILVDRAVSADDIDRDEAKKELDEALAALRKPESDEAFERLLDDRAWGQARLKL